MKESTFSSAAHGTRTTVETTIEGRVVLDAIQFIRRNYKLSSYSLNAVSVEFLGQQKEDVHHSIISDLQRGSDEDRRRLAVYCLKARACGGGGGGYCDQRPLALHAARPLAPAPLHALTAAARAVDSIARRTRTFRSSCWTS